MKPLEFAEIIAKTPTDVQNAFFERLKSELSEEDVKTIMQFVSLVGMFKSPAKYEAMKNAVCDQLCEEIYGHTVESMRHSEDSVLISMYSNSIL